MKNSITSHITFNGKPACQCQYPASKVYQMDCEYPSFAAAQRAARSCKHYAVKAVKGPCPDYVEPVASVAASVPAAAAPVAVKLSDRQVVALQLMAQGGVSFRRCSMACLTTWFGGEVAVRYRNGKALSDAGLIIYSGSKQLEPYRESWHVTDAGRAFLQTL